MEEEIKKLVSINSWFISLQFITLLSFLGGAAFIYADMQSLKQSIAASASRGGGPSMPKEVANWVEYIRGHDADTGDKAAKIELVEFTDFQCPYCRAFNENTRKKLLSKYGDKIHMVFKNYPLPAHAEAKPAALAAQCALREGKFWEIKDIFFANPDKLSTGFLINAGKSLGLGSRYADCITNQETLAEVEQDMEDGMNIGVQGTPTFLINGKVAMGAISLAQVDSIIEGLTKAQKDAHVN